MSAFVQSSSRFTSSTNKTFEATTASKSPQYLKAEPTIVEGMIARSSDEEFTVPMRGRLMRTNTYLGSVNQDSNMLDLKLAISQTTTNLKEEKEWGGFEVALPTKESAIHKVFHIPELVAEILKHLGCFDLMITARSISAICKDTIDMTIQFLRLTWRPTKDEIEAHVRSIVQPVTSCLTRSTYAEAEVSDLFTKCIEWIDEKAGLYPFKLDLDKLLGEDAIEQCSMSKPAVKLLVVKVKFQDNCTRSRKCEHRKLSHTILAKGPAVTVDDLVGHLTWYEIESDHRAEVLVRVKVNTEKTRGKCYITFRQKLVCESGDEAGRYEMEFEFEDVEANEVHRIVDKKVDRNEVDQVNVKEVFAKEDMANEEQENEEEGEEEEEENDDIWRNSDFSKMSFTDAGRPLRTNNVEQVL